MATMAELLEKARVAAAECGAASDHPLLQLVEDVCREGERLAEEARKEQKDLLQQVNFWLLLLVIVFCEFHQLQYLNLFMIIILGNFILY